MCTLFFLLGNLSGLCVAFAWLGWRPRHRVVGTPSASHNSSSLPRCFYSAGSSCAAKTVVSCDVDFDSCQHRSRHW